MDRHPLTVEDLWTLPRVGGPVPSPDGKRLLVPVSTCDMEANEATTRLWIVPATAEGAGSGKKGDPARALTTAEASSGQPSWSPDGSRIAFVRKPGGDKKMKTGPQHPDVPQLFVMPADGGEPERLTDLPLGVADPQWFPDGRRIAFIGNLYREAPTVDESAERKKARDEDPVKAHVTEHRFYRYWDHWLTDGKFHHVFVMDIETGEQMDLTPDCWRMFPLMDPTGIYTISPDGREIAFDGIRGDPPYDLLVGAVYTVRVPVRIRRDAKAPRPRELTQHHPADAFGHAYSKDGRWLVYGIQREIDFYADKVRLVAYDREEKTHTVLTEDWALSPMGWRYGGDSRTLYFLAEVEARTAIFKLDVPRAARNPGRNRPKEIARGGTHTPPRPAGGRIFASVSTLTSPSEVISVSTSGSDPRMVTAFTAPVMKGIEPSRVEDVVFEGAEGDPVQMFVLHPPGRKIPRKGEKPKKRFPLVHMIHGGPHGVFGDQWHWRWNAMAFAAPGYVTALVNFHGSTSWGQDFAASILGRWGDQPYEDIMAGTDWLVKRGYVNRRRMAVTGGSYGGYLVSWIAAKTGRFACIVNHAGVCDFQTQYASDVTQGRARSMGGEPWERIDGMDRYNPMRHAKGFESPMLVVHGMRDYRVPYNQALEIYNVYKAMKLPARLVVYPDENHWILKPRNSVHWYGEVLGWLKRWLG
jgi:dipeptidyl aminopeptidase/acylaminoacyl peptidase